jgi:hypothetical protein
MSCDKGCLAGSGSAKLTHHLQAGKLSTAGLWAVVAVHEQAAAALDKQTARAILLGMYWRVNECGY